MHRLATIYAALLLSVGSYAQSNFECEGAFYMSNYDPDYIHWGTTLYLMTYDNNQLEVEEIAQYDVNVNAIALNPFDGLIYAFDTETQEIIKLYPDGTFLNLGHPPGLFDLNIYFSSGAFDDLGRYILTGYNQFISIIDVSCDEPIVLSQIERSSQSFFGDIAYHPQTGLLYGYEALSKRLSVMDINSGQVTLIGQEDEQFNLGALFFDDDGNLYGYEADIFYRVNTLTGVVTQVASNVDTRARDGASCVNIEENTLRYTPIVEMDVCNQRAKIVVDIPAVADKVVNWLGTQVELHNEDRYEVIVTESGSYDLEIIIMNACNDEIHREFHEIEVDIPAPISVNEIFIEPALCGGMNGELRASFSTDQEIVEYQLNAVSQDHGQFENLFSGNYMLTVTSEYGCELDLNVEIPHVDCDIYIPSAFSPNNDGINDRLEFFVQDRGEFQVLNYDVFDRWGNKVFDPPPFSNLDESGYWDGMIDARPAPSGVYILSYTIQWPDMTIFQSSQSVLLVD